MLGCNQVAIESQLEQEILAEFALLLLLRTR